eukprot:264456-Chlamydomonas_euryale.AAC.3
MGLTGPTSIRSGHQPGNQLTLASAAGSGPPALLAKQAGSCPPNVTCRVGWCRGRPTAWRPRAP